MKYDKKLPRNFEKSSYSKNSFCSACKTLGIDLGTTNSAAAFMEGGKPEIVITPDGGRTTPSVVAINSNGDRIVGQVAKRQAVVNPANTYSSIKRLIGRKMAELGEELKKIPFEVSEDDNGYLRINSKYGNNCITPEEISAQILAKLVEDSEKHTGAKVNKAVLTVPAYFNDTQRQSTKDAGSIAGLEILRIINEPTAASLRYGLDKTKNEKVLIFDLGGGTFDVSLLEVGEGVFEVITTSGDSRLGGDDFDKCIVDWLLEEAEKTQALKISGDFQALQRITEAAEKAKIDLSASGDAKISLPFITASSAGPKHIETTLSRTKFVDLVAELLDRCRKPVEQALRDANMTISEIAEVILVGGTSRIPAVKNVVRQISGREPHIKVQPDEIVALGAALQAGVLVGEVSNIILLDVTPLSLGVETVGGLMTKLIPRNTTLPCNKNENFSTSVDGQTSVEINVLQGERDFVSDNKSLGNFRLDGISPAPRGSPQIAVQFDIDVNGILTVSAVDKGNGKKADIEIKGASRLAQDEIERILRDSDKFATDDKIKREAATIKIEADSLIYLCRNQLSEFKEKIPNEMILEAEKKCDALDKSTQDNDIEKTKSLLDDLRQSVNKISEFATQNMENKTESHEK